MGWASTFEHIQERRDEAEYFRRAALAIVGEHSAEPARAAIHEPVPQPASVGEVRVTWVRRWDKAFTMIFGQHCSVKAAIGASDKGGAFEITSPSLNGVQTSARIRSEDFASLIRAMVLANKQVALDAMTAELRRVSVVASSSPS